MKKIYLLMLIIATTFSTLVSQAQTFTVGTGTSTNSSSGEPAPLQDYFGNSRRQYLYKAADLTAAGLLTGNVISKIGFNVTAVNGATTIENYTIKYTWTTVNALTTTFQTTATNVVFGPTNITPTAAGNFDMQLSANISAWNGTDNLLIEICEGVAGGGLYSSNYSSPYTTSAATATYYISDGTAACPRATGTLSGNRPNIRLSLLPPPCTGTPVPGNTTTTSSTTCVGGTVTLGIQNTPSASGITYQWYSSTDGSTYNPIPGATSPTYTATVNTNTYYQADVTCTTGPATGTSNPILITNVACNYATGYTPGITYNSIASTGASATWQSTSGDDNTTTNITLPFSFQFKGTNYTTVNACTNGWLGFGGTIATSFSNTLNSSFNGSTALVAPFWDDLVVTGQVAASLPTSFKYQTIGTSPNQVFIAEWIGLETYNNPGPNLNFQVKLYETSNKVEFVYGTMEGFNGTASNTYTYSLGLRGSATDYISLQKYNSNYFSTGTSNDALALTPLCNSMYSFTPSGTFSTGANPPAVTPANDDPATATTVAVNSGACSSYCSTYYETTGATASAVSTVCSAATAGTPDDDVWFKFVATNATQNITVFGGGGYDAVVQAFSDAGVTSIGCANATGSGLTEVLSLTGLTVNNTYYVRVYHAGTGNGTTAQISICVSAPAPPPVNDDPCGAVTLTTSATCSAFADNSANSTTSVTSATTTTQSSAGNLIAAPTCTGAGTTVSDVWFKFTASGDRHGITLTPVSGFDVAIQAFSRTGSCGTNDLALTPIGCVNSASTGGVENVTISTTIGSEYYLRVYRHPSGIAGAPVNNSQFSICITNPIPVCATNVTPANNATAISNTPTLTFNRVSYASSYDVYLGATAASATLIGNVADPNTGTTASYTVTTSLAPLTQYFWYVIPKNSNGGATGCSTSNATSFTTASAPPDCTFNISPTDGATGINSPVTFTWAAAANATSYDLYVGTTNPPTSTIATSIAGTTYTWSGAASNTTYIWYVVPRNAGGPAVGCSGNTTSFTTALFACTPIYTTPPCASLGGDSVSVFILNGERITVNNNSGGYCGDAGGATGNGYSQYLGLARPDMAGGKSYVGSLKNNPSYDEYVSIWIDFNDDLVFSASEKLLSGMFLPFNTTTPFSIFIPTGSNPGTHRLRMRVTETSGAVDPCTTLSYGEAEDYLVDILPSGSGTPYSISTVGAGACAGIARTTISSAANNANETVPILDASGNIVASINANGNNLGLITSSLYINNSGTVRTSGAGRKYLDRNATITVATQPSSAVTVKMYVTAAEYTALRNAPGSAVSTPADMNLQKNQDACSAAITALTTNTANRSVSSYGSDYIVQGDVTGFSTFYVGANLIVVPVSIEYFKGTKQTAGNILDWKIACTSGLTITLERSADKVDYKALNTQNATVDRCLTPFTYTDATPLSGSNYYRLKMVTPDGEVRYSNIVLLINKDKGFEFVSVVPNPVKTTTTLTLSSAKAGMMDIKVSDVAGKVIITQRVTVIAGSNSIPMTLTTLAAGTYQITASNTDGDSKSVRFVKY